MHARLLLLTVFACAATQGGVVDRTQVTLGALSDSAHAVAQVRVQAVEAARVQLDVEGALKGASLLGARLWLPRGQRPLSWAVGERWLVFLSHDGRGWRPLGSDWQRIPDGGPAYAEAVRSRLPRLDGPAGALQDALFVQLGAPEARIATDAAYDLLGFQRLQLTGAQLDRLRLALDRRPAPELFRLCARIGDPALAASVLRAARQVGADDAALQPAAEALRAVDPNAMQSLAGDLAGPEAGAVRALSLLGEMGQGAHAHLQGGLGDARAPVRAAAIRALARSAEPVTQAQANALLQLVRRGEPDEQRLALAALARVGPAALLKAVAREHPDLGLRALAEQLRRDPSELPRRILGE